MNNYNYFTAAPQCNKNFLFGRDKELEEFERFSQNTYPLCLITGMRRTGKTSLIKTFFSEHKDKCMYIDTRELGDITNKNKVEVLEFFCQQISIFLQEHEGVSSKVSDFLRRINGVTIGVAGIQLDPTLKHKINLMEIFRRLNDWAHSEEKIIIIGIDEAQNFKKNETFDITLIFASIYDSYSNLKIILTGSEMGVIYELVGKEDPQAPLHGRDIPEIKLKPLTIDKRIKFLEAGLKNNSIPINKSNKDVIKIAAEKLGSRIGWLTMFGCKCCDTKKIVEQHIDDIVEKNAKLAKEEFDKFLKNKQQELYSDIMNHLANMGSYNFREYFDKRSDTKKCLSELEKEGFIYEEEQNRYNITDFVLKYALKSNDFRPKTHEDVKRQAKNQKKIRRVKKVNSKSRKSK